MEPQKLQAITNALHDRLGVELREIPESALNQAQKRDIYQVTDTGIGVIDITGSLVNRFPGGVEAMSGLTSYEELSQEVEKAVTDPKVRGIMLRLQSGGGEASGVQSLSEQLVAANKVKPVWASVDDFAYSAAYWLASSAGRIYVTPTGGVGSIGVIAQHVDQSKMEAAAGLKVTTIAAGARKADFSPHEPLSDTARGRLQDLVEQNYSMFVDAVSQNRSIGKKAVRATEATTFHGQSGIDAGLADRMGDFRTAMSDMVTMLGRGKREDTIHAVITERKSETRSEQHEERQMAVSELRAADADSTPLITGHIAVFEQLSIDIGNFREQVMPGAFSKSIKEADIHHYFNHDTNVVLGRNRSGTLRLSEDNKGLYIENDPPNTQLVRDMVLEPIRRGDIDQGSFAFLPVRQEWGRKDGELIRTLHEVRLFHTSIVPKGAYPQADVALRAMATAANIDFSTLATISGKCHHNIALSDEESAFLKDTIQKLSSIAHVAPGIAAHPTQSDPPPLNRSALRNRIELLRRRIAV